MKWYEFLGPVGAGIGAAINGDNIGKAMLHGLAPGGFGLASLMKGKKKQKTPFDLLGRGGDPYGRQLPPAANPPFVPTQQGFSEYNFNSLNEMPDNFNPGPFARINIRGLK